MCAYVCRVCICRCLCIWYTYEVAAKVERYEVYTVIACFILSYSPRGGIQIAFANAIPCHCYWKQYAYTYVEANRNNFQFYCDIVH